MMMMRRRPRSRLDLLKPNVQETLLNKQSDQKRYHDVRARDRQFEVGDDVYYSDYSVFSKDKYSPRVVTKKTGPVSIEIEGDKGTQRKHDF